MLAVFEGILVLAVIFGVGVQLWAMVWKVKIAMVKVARAISANPVVAFVVKAAMMLYFVLIVPVIDRAVN